jgi:hypothetical protein
MAKAIFLAWSDPVDDAHDSEFNAWYDGTHMPQVRAAIPAITAAHRYRMSGLPAVGAPPAHRYLAIYELDTDDVAAAALALRDAGVAGRLDPTTTMDTTANPPVLAWYQALA